jgi:hypothetical protein
MVVVIQGEGVIFFDRKSSIKKLKFGCGFAALGNLVATNVGKAEQKTVPANLPVSEFPAFHRNPAEWRGGGGLFGFLFVLQEFGGIHGSLAFSDLLIVVLD